MAATNNSNSIENDLEEEIDEIIETDPDEADHHPIVDDDAVMVGTKHDTEAHADYKQKNLAYDSHYFEKHKK